LAAPRSPGQPKKHFAGQHWSDNRIVKPMASVLISLGFHIIAIIILALVIKEFNGLATSPLILSDEEALPEESFEPIPLNIEAQEDAVEHESFSVTDLDVPANDDLASHLVSPELSTETDFGGFGEALSSLPLMLEHAGEAFSLSSVEGAPGGRSRRSGGLGSEQAFGGDIGRRLARAGAKTGAIQVSLAWNNINDIDLHVVSPTGERVFFGNRQSRCWGCLDVDMNAGGPQSTEPVENIYWPRNGTPRGTYQVFVHHFANHGGPDPTAFEVHVFASGKKAVVRGIAIPGRPPAMITEFDHGIDEIPGDFQE
jgi:hypothetical protein